MSDSSVVCSNLPKNNSFLFFELLRFRSGTVKATVRVQFDAASHGASKAAITVTHLSVSFYKPSRWRTTVWEAKEEKHTRA